MRWLLGSYFITCSIYFREKILIITLKTHTSIVLSLQHSFKNIFLANQNITLCLLTMCIVLSTRLTPNMYVLDYCSKHLLLLLGKDYAAAPINVNVGSVICSDSFCRRIILPSLPNYLRLSHCDLWWSTQKENCTSLEFEIRRGHVNHFSQ